MENNIFKTSDTPLAAYLLTVHIPLLALEKIDDKRVGFVFNAGTNFEIQAYVDLFDSKQAAVDASTFYDNIKFLKKRIYQFNGTQAR